MGTDDTTVSAADSRGTVIPFVRLHSSAGCTAYRKGHLCHIIQTTRAMEVVKANPHLLAWVDSAESVIEPDRSFTRLALTTLTGESVVLVNHEADLADRIVTGRDLPYVWEPTFGVLFATAPQQRDALNSGAITLAEEDKFEPCIRS